MKFARLLGLLLLAVTLFSACTYGPITTPTASSSLPDLVVSNVYLGMLGVPTNWIECIPNYGTFEIRAMIRNMGQTPVYDFDVVELSTGTKLAIGELGAGQGMELYFPLGSPHANYNVVLDPQNLIPEGNESNNTLAYLAITPTPPVLCTPSSPLSSKLSTPSPASESGRAILSLSVLQNSKYNSPDWGEFQLKDGIYYRLPLSSHESPDSYTTHIQERVFYGDININGIEDALVILSTQNGGSGHFIELAALLNQNGSAYNVSTVYLGDRVVVESGKVENGTIVLNLRVQGPDDGLCCPSQFVTWTFVLNGDQLVKMP